MSQVVTTELWRTEAVEDIFSLGHTSAAHGVGGEWMHRSRKGNDAEGDALNTTTSCDGLLPLAAYCSRKGDDAATCTTRALTRPP